MSWIVPLGYAYPRLGITALGGRRIQTRTADYTVPEVRHFASSENAIRQPDTLQGTQQLLSNLLAVWRGVKHVNIQRDTSRENKEFWSGLCSYGIWHRTSSEFFSVYSAIQYGVSKLSTAVSPWSSAISKKKKHELHCWDSLTSRNTVQVRLLFLFIITVYFLLWKMIVKCSWVKFEWEEVKCRHREWSGVKCSWVKCSEM
jgi:hypothetical protein